MLISSTGKKGSNFTLYIPPTLNFQLISIEVCQEIELISIISIFLINISRIAMQNMTIPPKQVLKYTWHSKKFSFVLENYNST